jgi:hypothetical protein
MLPALRASSDVNSCALPDAWAARPPSAAISRCCSGSIDAKPRLLVSLWLLPPEFELPLPLPPLLDWLPPDWPPDCWPPRESDSLLPLFPP